MLNPGEGIKISAFKLDGTLEAQNDHELEKLGRYLVWLASHSDFRSVDHKVSRPTLDIIEYRINHVALRTGKRLLAH